MKLNEKLIKLRKDNNLSQEEFGNKINVSKQTVSKWEKSETKPDIKNIQEIRKKFNISLEYLLNDNINSLEEVADKTKNQNKSQKNSKTKKSSFLKTFIKIFLIILAIYFLIVTYKIIIFSRFYFIANSFSEENYMMFLSNSYTNYTDPSTHTYVTTKKYRHKFVTYTTIYEGSKNNVPIDENNCMIINYIDYLDGDKQIDYSLTYNKDTKQYVYNDTNSIFKEENKNGYTEKELDILYDFNRNSIKETTLSTIPSNVAEILISSLNPFCIVSNSNRSITTYSIINQRKTKIVLNTDFIVSSIQMNSAFDGILSNTYSYDYVPDHQHDFEDPTDTYKDQIVYDTLY